MLLVTSKIRVSGVWVLGLVALVSFCLDIFALRNDHPVVAFYSPATRFWELSIGAMLAYAALRQDLFEWTATAKRRNTLSVLGAGLITAALVLLNSHRQFPGWWALLPTLGAAAIIAAGPDSICNRLISNRIVVGIGLISFPLYLWHWPLLTFVRVLAPDQPAMIWLAVTGGFVLSCGTYWLIERRLRSGSRLGLKAALLILTMASLGGAGYAVYANDGLSFRPIVVQAAMAKDYDPVIFYQGTGCFLNQQGAEGFQDDRCFRKEFPGRPIVFLMGDSYSAYLSQGLRPFLHDQGINLGQFSAASCAPFASDSPRCAAISSYIMREVADVRPDVVVIFGRYQGYFGVKFPAFDGSTVVYEDLLSKTIQRFKDVGVKKVILLGDPPSWNEDLPKLMLRHFLLRGIPIPDRILEGIDGRFLKADAALKKRAYPVDVSYLSLADALCDTAGCRPLVGPDFHRDLLSFDTGHFTKSGADFMVHNMIGPAIKRALAP